MMGRSSTLIAAILLAALFERARGAEAGPEWQRLAKQEGKGVIGAPPGSDFRNEARAL